MHTEEKLNAIIAGHAGLAEVVQQLHDKLSQKIMEQALGFSNPDATTLAVPAGSIVPAACFMVHPAEYNKSCQTAPFVLQ